MNDFFLYPNTKDVFPIYYISPHIISIMNEHLNWVKEVWYVNYKLLSSTPYQFNEKYNIIDLSIEAIPISFQILSKDLQWEDKIQMFQYSRGKYITSQALCLYMIQQNPRMLDLSDKNILIAIMSCASTLGFVTSFEKQEKPYNYNTLLFDFKPLSFASLELPVQREFMTLCATKNPILITGSTGIGKTVVFPILIWRYDLFYTGFDKNLNISEKQEFRRTGIVMAVPRKVMAVNAVKTYLKNTGFKKIQGSPFNVIFQDVPHNLKNYSRVESISRFNICVDALTGIFQNITSYIFDEVHEHSKFSDIYISIMLKSQSRVVLVSATIENELETLKEKIPNLRQIHVEGPTRFTIEEHKFDSPNLYQLILDNKKPETVIIVFTSSENKCSHLMFCFEDFLSHKKVTDVESMIYTRSIAQKNPESTNRFSNTSNCLVVFATNILESSVTILRATVVFDFGIQYSVYFRSGITTNINYSSYIQRKGRVGRVRDGKYYRSFDLEELESSTSIIDRNYLIDYIVHLFNAKLSFEDLITQPSDPSRYKKTLEYYRSKNVDLKENAKRIIAIKRSKKCSIDEHIIIYLFGSYEECETLQLFEDDSFEEDKDEFIKSNIDIFMSIAKQMNIRVSKTKRKYYFIVEEEGNFENANKFIVSKDLNLFGNRSYLLSPNHII